MLEELNRRPPTSSPACCSPPCPAPTRTWPARASTRPRGTTSAAPPSTGIRLLPVDRRSGGALSRPWPPLSPLGHWRLSARGFAGRGALAAFLAAGRPQGCAHYRTEGDGRVTPTTAHDYRLDDHVTDMLERLLRKMQTSGTAGTCMPPSLPRLRTSDRAAPVLGRVSREAIVAQSRGLLRDRACPGGRGGESSGLGTGRASQGRGMGDQRDPPCSFGLRALQCPPAGEPSLAVGFDPAPRARLSSTQGK